MTLTRTAQQGAAARELGLLVTVSTRPLVRPRAIRLAGLAAAAAALVVVAVASVAYGSKPIPLGEVFAAIFDFDASNNHLIVRSLRIPRTVVGIGVGAALGLAGAVMQGVPESRSPPSQTAGSRSQSIPR